MVEQVEYVGAKLELCSFRQRNTLCNSHIGLPRARCASQVTRSIAECSRGRHGKCGRIDPFRDPSAAWRCERSAWYKIRPLIVGVAVRNVRRAPVQGDVHREAGARAEDRVDLPGTQNVAQDSRLIQIGPVTPEGKLVHSIYV